MIWLREIDTKEKRTKRVIKRGSSLSSFFVILSPVSSGENDITPVRKTQFQIRAGEIRNDQIIGFENEIPFSFPSEETPLGRGGFPHISI